MSDTEVDFSDLPQFCKDYSDEQTERVVEWYSHLGLDDLRQRQSIVIEQYSTGCKRLQEPAAPPWLVLAVEDLDGRADHLMLAIGRWLDRKNGKTTFAPARTRQI